MPPGTRVQYKSIDTVTEEHEAVTHPIELINSLDPPGMPFHVLNPPKLCNGTRIVIKNLTPNSIEATIINGKFKRENIFLYASHSLQVAG